MIARIFVVADIEAKSEEDAKRAAEQAIQMIRQGALVHDGAFGTEPAPEIRKVSICSPAEILEILVSRG